MAVEVLYRDGQNLYAGTYGSGVFRSADNGMTRKSVNTGLRNLNVFAFAAVSSALFAGTLGGGVYQLRDDGAGWSECNSRLGNTVVRALSAYPAGVFAGTTGGGVWHLQTSSIPASVEGSRTGDLSGTFSLAQNYPNPFNPSTRINFEVAVSGFVTVKVFDGLGREVRTLVNEELKAGSYETTFSAEGVSSGIYFCRMTAGSFSEVRRMVMVK